MTLKKIKNIYLNSFTGGSLMSPKEKQEAKKHIKKQIHILTKNKKLTSKEFLLKI
ncbi:MAG: hypothetical protein BAJALOKI1v1_10042 [Promethearchaeota archaeon]|nr:MAG: hypothetical protein BAJALOKI1v1_10042 [Candidatus Lokiarchaeota archaeon]